MKENYLISIIGDQVAESGEDQTSITTVGNYIKRGNKQYIIYRDYEGGLLKDGVTSILKVDGEDCVTLIKNGSQQSRIILENGKRHYCSYQTEFGPLMLGIFTRNIKSDLSEKGGSLTVKYSLDINSALTSINEIYVNIKEKQPQDVKNTDSFKTNSEEINF